MTIFNRREVFAGASALGLALPFAGRAAAPAAMPPSGPGDADAAKLLADIADRLVAEYPENATYYGIDTGAKSALRAQLTDRSAYGERARAEWAGDTYMKLHGVDRAKLSPAQALDVDVAEEAFRLAVDGWKLPYGDMAVLSGQNSFRNSPYTVTQLSGAFVDVPDFLENKHRVETVADAAAYCARLEAFAGELTSENERLTHDYANKIVPPDFVLDVMFTQRIMQSYDPVAKWGLIQSFREKLAKTGLPDRYAAQAEQICTAKVVPALDNQMDLIRTARTGAFSDAGVWKLPQGDQYYAWALAAGTTTTATAEEMHAAGQEQIARIHAEMDVILKAQGLSQGSVGERMLALSKKPDLLFANTDEGRAKLLAYLNGRIEDMRGRLPRAFATLVKGNLIIKRVPPSIQDGAPNGYAAPGSIDGSLPGIYYINLKDTANWPRYALPTLCYHEGIPGHVWQGEYANRLPLIRTHLAFNAYSEGWALYSEQLGDELGCYDHDPLGRLGYLQSIGFRACRLVVDTGLHAKRWTLDQAIAWMQANTGMPSGGVRSEVVRYCAMPGQACGYKMGHNKINALRDKAKTALGPKFDLRRFDDAMVLSGNVPLTLLERIADRYIASA